MKTFKKMHAFLVMLGLSLIFSTSSFAKTKKSKYYYLEKAPRLTASKYSFGTTVGGLAVAFFTRKTPLFDKIQKSEKAMFAGLGMFVATFAYDFYDLSVNPDYKADIELAYKNYKRVNFAAMVTSRTGFVSLDPLFQKIIKTFNCQHCRSEIAKAEFVARLFLKIDKMSASIKVKKDRDPEKLARMIEASQIQEKIALALGDEYSEENLRSASQLFALSLASIQFYK